MSFTTAAIGKSISQYASDRAITICTVPTTWATLIHFSQVPASMHVSAISECFFEGHQLVNVR